MVLHIIIMPRITQKAIGQGRPQDLAGGAKNFFQIWKFACRKALLGGFGGMLPRENFSKWCNLVRFCVYFVFKKFQKLPFFI